MNKHSLLQLGCCLLLLTKSTLAASIIDIKPSSLSPVVISTTGTTYVTYSAKNNTSKILNSVSLDPAYGIPTGALKASLINNTCTTLAAGASCTFTVSLQGSGQNTMSTLTPRICLYNGATCSIPILSDRIQVTASKALPSSEFPRPYAGTFYPIYNMGAGEWLPPNQLPTPPFNRVSAIFVAFAHAYPQHNGAIINFEKGQPDEPARLTLLAQTARAANPGIKILISLGWDKDDWTYINTDYVNRANIFVPSVIQFIRANKLDGLDIDDESIGGSTGSIPQNNFNGVIANLRNALNTASLQDNKPYYLTITPAGNNDEPGGIDDTQVDALNAKSFDLINIQTYYGDGEWGIDFYDSLIAIGYPINQIANGIDVEKTNCNPDSPPYIGMAGLFNWNMTKDSICSDYSYTITLADLVGYYGTN